MDCLCPFDSLRYSLSVLSPRTLLGTLVLLLCAHQLPYLALFLTWRPGRAYLALPHGEKRGETRGKKRASDHGLACYLATYAHVKGDLLYIRDDDDYYPSASMTEHERRTRRDLQSAVRCILPTIAHLPSTPLISIVYLGLLRPHTPPLSATVSYVLSDNRPPRNQWET